MIKLIHYLDVLSSWCFYSEPSVRRLLDLYGDRIDYEWRIALVSAHPPRGYSRQQYDWFYRRSGSIAGMQLNSAWRSREYDSTLEANLAAEAARELGFSDDSVRLALARAALLEGKPVLERETCVQVVADVAGVDREKIAELMDEPRIRQRIDRTSREFDSLGIDQRPAFVFRSKIGDSAVFSGIWMFEPLAATVQAMLSDADKYAHFEATNPPLPAS